MLGCLAATWGAAIPGAQASADALSRGLFVEALEETEWETNPLRQARQRADVFYAARDFEAVLETCRAGLELESGEDPWLLWRSAGSALWLRDGELAAAFASRLGGAAADDPDPARAEFWSAQAAAFQEQAEGHLAAAQDRDAAVNRARTAVAGWALVLVAGAVLWRRV